MKIWVNLSLVMLVVCVAPAGAEDNYLKANFWDKASFDYNRDNEFEDRGSNHLESIIEGGFQLTEGLDLVAGVKLDYFAFVGQDEWSNKFDLRAHNAYLSYSKKEFDVRLGNQLVIWGKTDEISPLNTVNPEDLRDGFVRRRSERKLPTPMLNARYFGSEVELQFLFLPVFMGSEIRKNDSNWAYFGKVDEKYPDLVVNKDQPSGGLGNAEYGMRASKTLENFDLAVSYLHRRNRTPMPDSLIAVPGGPAASRSASLDDLAAYAAATGQEVNLSYAKTNQFGIELEASLDEIVIRGDLAFLTSQPFINANTLAREDKNIISYVLGADYQSSGDLYVNLQFSQQIILDYDSNILIFPEVSAGISGEVSQLLAEGQIKPSLYHYFETVDGGYYLNPTVMLKYWENFEVELGVDIVGGPRDSIVGFYRDNDQVYITTHFYL